MRGGPDRGAGVQGGRGAVGERGVNSGGGVAAVRDLGHHIMSEGPEVLLNIVNLTEVLREGKVSVREEEEAGLLEEQGEEREVALDPIQVTVLMNLTRHF